MIKIRTQRGVISIFNRLSTETVNWILIIGLILFVLEVVFFRGGLIFTAALLGLASYYGYRNRMETWGKVIFWIGVIGLIITVLNMLAVRFIVLVFIILLLIDYSKNKKQTYIIPKQYINGPIKEDEVLVDIHPIFKSILRGQQNTPSTAYEWRDINIFSGIGDKVIDLSQSITRDDTAVISIRHGIGNMIIYIPYDTEFVIHHSAVFGRAYILNKRHEQLLNQQLSYQTENYIHAQTRVKIITSVFSGNIEVKRI